MPLTLKLSQQFYDRLGNEVVNELVDVLNSADEAYRADLFRVNELNFVRFDARLEQRLAEFKAEVVERMAAFEVKIERRLTAFETAVDRRITEFERKIEQRMAEFEARLERRNAEFEVKIETRLIRTERRLLGWMFAFWTGQVVALAGLLFLFLHRS